MEESSFQAQAVPVDPRVVTPWQMNGCRLLRLVVPKEKDRCASGNGFKELLHTVGPWST